MRHIETIRGKGIVTSNGGEQAVQHELEIYQDDIRVRTREDPNGSIPGMKSIRGWIKPICFFGEDTLVLTMQDGRKLPFFFTDSRGSIRAKGGFE
jgi:hypothetical protein